MFTAKYPGRCSADCGASIRPGDDVEFVDDQLVHASCADTASQGRERPVVICPTCHLTKPCDCEAI